MRDGANDEKKREKTLTPCRCRPACQLSRQGGFPPSVTPPSDVLPRAGAPPSFSSRKSLASDGCAFPSLLLEPTRLVGGPALFVHRRSTKWPLLVWNRSSPDQRQRDNRHRKRTRGSTPFTRSSRVIQPNAHRSRLQPSLKVTQRRPWLAFSLQSNLSCWRPA